MKNIHVALENGSVIITDDKGKKVQNLHYSIDYMNIINNYYYIKSGAVVLAPSGCYIRNVKKFLEIAQLHRLSYGQDYSHPHGLVKHNGKFYSVFLDEKIYSKEHVLTIYTDKKVVIFQGSICKGSICSDYVFPSKINSRYKFIFEPKQKWSSVIDSSKKTHNYFMQEVLNSNYIFCKEIDPNFD